MTCNDGATNSPQHQENDSLSISYATLNDTQSITTSIKNNYASLAHVDTLEHTKKTRIKKLYISN